MDNIELNLFTPVLYKNNIEFVKYDNTNFNDGKEPKIITYSFEEFMNFIFDDDYKGSQSPISYENDLFAKLVEYTLIPKLYYIYRKRIPLSDLGNIEASSNKGVLIGRSLLTGSDQYLKYFCSAVDKDNKLSIAFSLTELLDSMVKCNIISADTPSVIAQGNGDFISAFNIAKLFNNNYISLELRKALLYPMIKIIEYIILNGVGDLLNYKNISFPYHNSTN